MAPTTRSSTQLKTEQSTAAAASRPHNNRVNKQRKQPAAKKAAVKKPAAGTKKAAPKFKWTAARDRTLLIHLIGLGPAISETEHGKLATLLEGASVDDITARIDFLRAQQVVNVRDDAAPAVARGENTIAHNDDTTEVDGGAADLEMHDAPELSAQQESDEQETEEPAEETAAASSASDNFPVDSAPVEEIAAPHEESPVGISEPAVETPIADVEDFASDVSSPLSSPPSSPLLSPSPMPTIEIDDDDAILISSASSESSASSSSSERSASDAPVKPKKSVRFDMDANEVFLVTPSVEIRRLSSYEKVRSWIPVENPPWEQEMIDNEQAFEEEAERAFTEVFANDETDQQGGSKRRRDDDEDDEERGRKRARASSAGDRERSRSRSTSSSKLYSRPTHKHRGFPNGKIAYPTPVRALAAIASSAEWQEQDEDSEEELENRSHRHRTAEDYPYSRPLAYATPTKCPGYDLDSDDEESDAGSDESELDSDSELDDEDDGLVESDELDGEYDEFFDEAEEGASQEQGPSSEMDPSAYGQGYAIYNEYGPVYSTDLLERADQYGANPYGTNQTGTNDYGVYNNAGYGANHYADADNGFSGYGSGWNPFGGSVGGGDVGLDTVPGSMSSGGDNLEDFPWQAPPYFDPSSVVGTNNEAAPSSTAAGFDDNLIDPALLGLSDSPPYTPLPDDDEEL